MIPSISLRSTFSTAGRAVYFDYSVDSVVSGGVRVSQEVSGMSVPGFKFPFSPLFP